MIHFSKYKKLFIGTMIGSLIGAALVAIVAILIGEFNETAMKALSTLITVVFHSLISLAFIWDDERKKIFERLTFFTNILFFIIVISFITSVFSIWGIITGAAVWNLYQTFFVVGFASLHSEILSKTLHKEKYLDTIVYLNYVFIGIVVLMLLPMIYVKNSFTAFGEPFYRILGAAAIVDGTLSILAIIFYRLYMHKHPEEQNAIFGGGQSDSTTQKKGLSIWIWILIIYLFLQIAGPLFLFLFALRMFG